MLALVLTIFIPILFGFILVFFLWPNQKPFYYDFLIKVNIATGLGFGISSAIYFLWLLVVGPNSIFIIFERVLFIFLITILICYLIKTRKFTLPSETDPEASVELKSRNLYIIFFALLVLGLIAFISLLLRTPHGGWDAWAIWNMKARFIFRSGEYWKGVFSNWYAHPDYPLFIPLTVARIWKAIGHETVIIPAALAMLFTFSTILLTFSSLTILRTKSQGLLAGLVLLGTPSYIREGALQLADHPLGFFFISTFILFTLYDRSFTKSSTMLLCLAGITAGFSAWTKNEGLLFLITIIIARSFVIIPIKGLRIFLHQISIFLLGLMPILLIILYFKMVIAPPNDMVSLQNISKTFLKLMEFSRYFQTMKVFLKTSMEFTRGIIGIPLLIVYLYLMGISKEKRYRISASTVGITLSLMLIGYFFAFITTPYDLNWHLASSPRLFLQLWPSFIFYFFMVVHSPEQMILKKGICSS
jgi:hypothetical protein